MKTRRIVLAIVIGLVSEACSAKGCAGSKQSSSPGTATPAQTSTPAPSTPTMAASLPSQRELYDDIQHKGLTPDRAKLLFSMAVGPLPGVTVPAGGRDTTDFCGTRAVGYLYRVWSTLTQPQRDAASRLIRGSATARNGGGAPASMASVGLLPMLTPVARFALASDTPKFDYQALAQNANATLAGYLGAPPVRFGPVIVNYGAPPGTTWALTWAWDTANNNVWPDGCHITVFDQSFQSLDATDAQAVITHEMFHCYQQRAASTAAAMTSVHDWIEEGEATWVMAAAVPAVSAGLLETKWTPYLFGPKTVYSNRKYDAIGVYGHMSDVSGGNSAVWPELLPMVASGVGGNDFAPFNLLTQSNQIQYFTDWGSSYFQSIKLPWKVNGPGDPPTSGPAPDSVSVDPGTVTTLAPVLAYQAGLSQLNGNADVGMVALPTGYGRLHDTGFGLDTALDTSGPLALCLLAATGTYGLIVNHDNSGPGAYRFVLQGASLNGK